MNSNLVTVEINGVKMEIDTRHARKIETLRVGSRVKVLVKSYGDSFNVYPGIIVGFDEFRELPTITACYLDIGYPKAELKFVAFNAQTKNVEIVAAVDHDELELSKSDVLSRLDREVESKRREITELEQHRAFFLAHFAAYFSGVTTAAQEE